MRQPRHAGFRPIVTPFTRHAGPPTSVDRYSRSATIISTGYIVLVGQTIAFVVCHFPEVGQPILAAAGFQPALAESRLERRLQARLPAPLTSGLYRFGPALSLRQAFSAASTMCVEVLSRTPIFQSTAAPVAPSFHAAADCRPLATDGVS